MGQGGPPPQKLEGGATLLYAQTSVQSGDTVANTTTETNFASSGTILKDTLAAGDLIVGKAWGVYGATLGPTLTLRLKAGSTTLLTVSYTVSGSPSARQWYVDFNLCVTAVGASGSCECQGTALFYHSTGNQLVEISGGTVTVDTTADRTLQLSAQWGTANVANTITLRLLHAGKWLA